MRHYFDYEKSRSDHAHIHSQFLLNYITKYRKQNQSLREAQTAATTAHILIFVP